jgi:hypothetical protein
MAPEKTPERSREDVENQRERIRQRIAFVLLGILAGTIFGSFVAYGLEATQTIDPTANQVTIRDLMTLVFAPLVGLVGAATGFYYGSTERHPADRGEGLGQGNSPTAVAAVRGDQAGTEPIITTVAPATGSTSASVDLEIQGQDFRMPRALRLVRGDQEIPATDVLASSTRIMGTVVLNQPSGGASWDVVVEFEDGTEARAANAFTITGA